MAAEKRITYEDFKIRGKQNELKNMIKYIVYIAGAKTILRYLSYFIEVQSSHFDKSHPSLFKISIKEGPDTSSITFYVSIIRFFVLYFIGELV